MREPRFIFVSAMIAAAAALRVLPYALARWGRVDVTDLSSAAWNMQPVTALCLFAGAYVAHAGARYAMPLAVIVLSNILIGLVMRDPAFYTFHSSIIAQFAGFLAVAAVGAWLRKGSRTVRRVAGTAVAAELLFFVVSNCGYWALTGWYPYTWAGFVECFDKATPFLYRSLLGTALFTPVLFGLARFGCARFAVLRARPAAGLASAGG
jgi:hypothetical protein